MTKYRAARRRAARLVLGSRLLRQLPRLGRSMTKFLFFIDSLEHLGRQGIRLADPGADARRQLRGIRPLRLARADHLGLRLQLHQLRRPVPDGRRLHALARRPRARRRRLPASGSRARRRPSTSCSTSSSSCRPSLALIYSGWPYAAFSIRFREVSIFSPAGIPIFPLKTLIPVDRHLAAAAGHRRDHPLHHLHPRRRWPQRLHDVEETESVILQEQQIHAARRGRSRGQQGGLSMTDPQVGMLMLGLFIFIIMLGFPIAFTLIAMGVGFGFYAYFTPARTFFENRVFTLLVQKTFEVTSNDVLVAVPLFLFMGYLVERANILDRLFHSLQISLKNVPGALAVATLVTCAMFATATGIVGAVVTLMGLLAFPAMLRAGYDVKLSAGVVCAGGCLGILIPPSILLIVYAATAGVSAVKLYAAAFLPGFLLDRLCTSSTSSCARRSIRASPRSCRRSRPTSPSAEVVWALATSFFPLALLIVSVLGAILFGLATPSEAAGVGALGAHRAGGRLWRAQFHDAAGFRLPHRSRRGDGLLPLYRIVDLFVGVRLSRRPGASSSSFFLGLNLSSTQFLLLTQVIIFLLGWPLEWTEIIIIFVPIFLPLLDDFAIDPIFFGILVALEHADGVQHAARCDGGLLSQGRRAAAGEAHGHLQWRAAIRVHGVSHHVPGLRLSGHRALAAGLPVHAAMSRAIAEDRAHESGRTRR